MRCTHREWILVVLLTQCGLPAAAGDSRQADAFARAWSTISAAQLDRLWETAHATGSADSAGAPAPSRAGRP